MDPLLIVIAATVLMAVFSVVSGTLGLRPGDDSHQIETRLRAFRPGSEGPVARTEDKIARLKQRSYSGFPVLSAFLAQFKGSEKVALQLERAGLPLRVGEYYMIRWGVAALFFVLPLVFAQSLLMLLVAAGAGLVGYMVPAFWISAKRKGRMTRNNAQLGEMLGLVSNSLKSGYGLMQSFEFAAKQMQPPLALELRRMLREANLGLSAEDSLNAMGERIDSKDLDMVLIAINIQRTVGGNLAEILDQVASTMRERERIRGEIVTLTSQQKMTGIVIGGLPVMMFLIFMVMNPGYMSLLFTEMAGRVMLAMSVGLEFLGYLTIKRIMAIEI